MDKNLVYLLEDDTPIEPETLKSFGLEEKDRLKLLSIWSIKHTIGPWNEIEAFENCVHALNKLPVEIDHIEGALPEHILNALKIFTSLKNEEFSHEVAMYIKFWFKEAGVLFMPDYEQFKQYQPNWFDKMKNLALNGPFPLSDEDFLHLQAIYYLKYNQ